MEGILLEELDGDDIKSERKQKQAEGIDVGEQQSLGEPAQPGEQVAVLIGACDGIFGLFHGSAAAVPLQGLDLRHDPGGGERIRQLVV